MTASRSARAIKFYLAESTNKSGFGRLSMGSNWSVLQERSYYSEVFCHTVWMSLDRDTRRIFLFQMWLPHQPLAITQRRIKTEKNQNIWRITTVQVNDTTGWICRSGRRGLQVLLWDFTCTTEMHNNSPCFWQQQSPFHTLPDSRESVDRNDVQSSLSCRAEGSPGQKSTDSSKCC